MITNKILMYLGISANVLAFNYIMQAVEILKQEQGHIKVGLLYKKVCELQKAKSSSAVERAIRHSIQQIHKRNPIFKKIYCEVPATSAFLYDLAFNTDVFVREIENSTNDIFRTA